MRNLFFKFFLWAALLSVLLGTAYCTWDDYILAEDFCVKTCSFPGIILDDDKTCYCDPDECKPLLFSVLF